MVMKVKEAFKLGASFGIFAWLVGILVGLLFKSNTPQPQATLNIAPITEGLKQSIQSGIDTRLAAKIIGWLNGLPLFDFMGLITLAIGGFLIVLIGSFVLDLLPKMFDPLRKTSLGRFVSIAVIGTIISGWIVTVWSNMSVIGVKLPTFTTVLTMVIYFAIIALLYSGLAKIAKGTQVSKLFIEA